MTPPAPLWAVLCVLIASIGFGLVPLFARGLVDAGLSPGLITMARYSFSAILLFPFLEWRAGTLWAFGSGIVVGLGYVGYVSALRTVPVATAGVLYMSYPLFTLIMGWLAFRDPPSRSAVIAAIAVFIAALIVAIPQGLTMGGSPWALAGIVLAPLGFGVAINVLTHKVADVSVASRVAGTALGSVLSLIPFVAITGGFTQMPEGQQWVWLGLLALTTAFVPQLLYSLAVPRVGAARSAVLGSVELPTMFAIGALVYHEALTIYELISGAILVLTIILSSARRVRGVRLNMVEPKLPREVTDGD